MASGRLSLGSHGATCGLRITSRAPEYALILQIGHEAEVLPAERRVPTINDFLGRKHRQSAQEMILWALALSSAHISDCTNFSGNLCPH